MKVTLGVSPEALRSGIKEEAARRILARWPMTKQINMQASGGLAFEAMRAEIDAVRDASNRIEAMHPIPLDFTDDKYWNLAP